MNKISLEGELDILLKKDVSSLLVKQNAEFDRSVSSVGEHYILFGAGRLGKVALAGLRKAGMEPIAFADNNPGLWNKHVNALQVFSPAEAANRFSHKAIFVVTVYTSQPVWDQLLALGLKVISFASLAWKYPDALIPHGDLELPNKIFYQSDDVRRAYSLWVDDTSRQEYLGQLKWRTSLDRATLPPHLPPAEIYFPGDLIKPSSSEVFVDCGAFDGDTVREFIKLHGSSFGQIIAIEPDPANYQTLQAFLSSLPENIKKKIKPIQYAIGARHEKVSFNATGTAASSITNGTLNNIDCIPLDDLLNGIHPTYIKMDIEGAEADAITGMQKILQRETPILAICLYHKQEHLWQIPLLIQSFSDQYNFFLRRYSDECWELVCYAIPANRLSEHRQSGD